MGEACSRIYVAIQKILHSNIDSQFFSVKRCSFAKNTVIQQIVSIYYSLYYTICSANDTSTSTTKTPQLLYNVIRNSNGLICGSREFSKIQIGLYHEALWYTHKVFSIIKYFQNCRGWSIMWSIVVNAWCRDFWRNIFLIRLILFRRNTLWWCEIEGMYS